MFASELLLQVVEESKLPECSSSHLHHWSPVPKSASQTGCFHLVVKNSNYPWFAQVTYRYKNSRRGGVLQYGKYAHTQQPNSHTQQVATPKNQKGKTKKLQQTLQTAVFDDNGDLGVKSLQTLFVWHNCDPQLSALCSS